MELLYAYNLATYQYLGTSGFVNAASAQPGITWTLIGSGNDPNTGDIYWGLDRFGRVDNCLWKKSTTTLAQIQYGYDRASNRTWRKDGVLTGYDELYTYDGLYRLNDQKRGTLNGTQTAITSGKFQQQWGLDATGNWMSIKQDNDGNGTWDLVQLRTCNKANEITDITNTTGPVWAKPSYDTAGNMVGIPNAGTTVTGSNPAWVPLTEAQWNTLTEAQWSALTENTGTTPQQLSASYDAWNRLVLISNGTQKISENVYDARGYRIRKDTYASGTLTEARHYYYTPGWQCVEERVGTSTTAERQFVWGLRYIDDLVLRDRSTANNGTMNERRYAMQDENWNTIAICDITGSIGERYAYSAYGSPVFMNGSGTVQSASAIGFETLYAGYRFDGNIPQMYYVRNRFLLPMIGTWNRRDPLGYVDGMGLLVAYFVVNDVDPDGTSCSASKRAQIIDGTLQYSCMCGWIDWTHAGSKKDKPTAGGLIDFLKVWKQIQEIAKQPRGGPPGQVCYGTSMKKLFVTSGVSACFWVSPGLSEKEMKCAAWGIFAYIQTKFEKHQRDFPTVEHSGFSPEDLPSDLIMFLRAISDLTLTVDQIGELCGVQKDKSENLKWCDAFDWETRNFEWGPVRCPAANTKCGEDTSDGPMRMPSKLSMPDCSAAAMQEGELWHPTGKGWTGTKFW